MSYPLVEQPPIGAEAFEVIDEVHSQSQAAILLMIANRLRGDDQVLALRNSWTVPAGQPWTVSEAEVDEFPIPRLLPSPTRVQLDAKRRTRGGVWSRAFAESASRLYAEPTASGAIELMALGLRHPVELVAVASAAAMLGLTPSPVEALKVLRKGVRSKEPIVRNVAATALARFAPADKSLRKLTRMDVGGAEPENVHTAALVHGTWSSSRAWWKPGGDFHTYLGTLRPDLYAAADRFSWTGGYSDAARDDGARMLRQWVQAHGAAGLDLFTHSHGGSVAMLATQAGLAVGKLVLMSCPVHVHKYAPDFAYAKRVISIRVKLDLVILADRGGQKFHDSRIEEHVLPIWFNHSATHDPAVWQRHNVQAMI